MNDIDASSFESTLLEKVRQKMDAEALSFRDVEDRTGISPSTLCRFFKGKEVSRAIKHKLERYLAGQTGKPKKYVKRVKLGGTDFVITIEAD